MLYSFFQNKLSHFVFSTFSAALFLIASLGLTPHAIAATASSTDDDFSFVVLGDFNGGACGRNDRVQRVINAANEIPDVDFFISTGDIIDGYKETVGDKTYASCFGQDPVATIGVDACPNGIPSGNMREMLAPLITRAPKPGLDSSFYMAIGNHDDNWGDNWYPDSCGGGICDLMDESVVRSILGHHNELGDICSTEKPASTHSAKFYYSFSYKGSYFIVLKQNNDYASMLSCNGVGEGHSSCESFCSDPSLVDDSYRNRQCYNVKQFDWLRAELETASAEHDNIFVFTHAVFLSGGDGHRPFSGASEVRTLLEEYNVKIAFNGHNHAYHRSHPVTGTAIDPENGTTYLTVGSSGGLFNSAQTTPYTAARHQAWTGGASSGHDYEFGMTTYSKVDVVGETIRVSTYNLHSETVAVDEFIVGDASGTDPVPDTGSGGDTGSNDSGNTGTGTGNNSGDSNLEASDADPMVLVNASAVSGSIAIAGDVDTYSFNVLAGERYTITAAGFDMKIKLLDDNDSTPTDYIDNDLLADDGEEYTFVADATGEIKVQIEHGDGYTNPVGTYTLAITGANTATLAFPSATGFGAKATGGRGGRVIKVTNLNASGPGSLQDALNQNEPRTIVFEVSGVIESVEPIVVRHGNVTIAGQTAPGAGITLKSRFYGAYDSSVTNIIVRHLRIRPHDFSEITGVAADQYDALQFSKNSNMIFDHVSVAFGVDETFDIYAAKDVTVQWSIIQEGSTLGDNSGAHNFGLISGPEGQRLSVNNNLFVNNANRNPAITNGPAEVLNNVIYNARHGFIHHNPASGDFNIVGNYFKQGPNNSLHPFYFDDDYNNAKYFLTDNYVHDPLDLSYPIDQSVDNPWSIPEYFTLDKPETTRADSSFNFSFYSSYVATPVSSSTQAYDNVLAASGNFPRDEVDLRDVNETQTGGGAWGARIPADLMSGLSATSAPLDSDNDGMADEWEIAQQLNPSVADHNTVMASGYTAIEDYINELADQLVPETNNGNDHGSNNTVSHFITTSVLPVDGGQVEGAGNYEEGLAATLSAVPAEGYQFVAWSGDINATENPLNITVNADLNITATFEAVASSRQINDIFDEGERAGVWVNFQDSLLLTSNGDVAEVGDRVKTIHPIRGTASEMKAYGDGYFLQEDINGKPYLEATGGDAYEFTMPSTSLKYVVAWAAKVDPAANERNNVILHGAVDYHYYEVFAGFDGSTLHLSTGWSGRMTRDLADSLTTEPHVMYYQHIWTGPYQSQPGDLIFDGVDINNGTEKGGNYTIGGGYKLSLLGQKWDSYLGQTIERTIKADLYGFLVLDGDHNEDMAAINAELKALFSEPDEATIPGSGRYEGNAAAGESKSVSCMACHGAAGLSNNDFWPNLAGQNKAYLIKQLHDFKDGSRIDSLMSPLAESLSEEDIADLAEFYSGL